MFLRWLVKVYSLQLHIEQISLFMHFLDTENASFLQKLCRFSPCHFSTGPCSSPRDKILVNDHCREVADNRSYQ